MGEGNLYVLRRLIISSDKAYGQTQLLGITDNGDRKSLEF